MPEKPTYEELEQKIKKLEEDVLLESETQFRQLFDQMKDGLAVYGVIDGGNDFVFKDINAAGERIGNVIKSEIIGKSLYEIRPNIDKFGLVEVLRRVWKTGKSEHHAERFYKDENLQGWFDNYIYKLDKENVVAIFADNTAKNIFENELKKSEERFRLAMKFANDGLFDWNLETNEIYYSPVWKRLLGYEDDELPNDFSIWETLTHPEDVERSWKLQNELINRKRDKFEIEFKMKHKNGHWIDILSRANAIFNEDNKAIRIIGTHVDITERKQAERRLLQKKKEAERYLNLAGVMFIGLDRYGNVNIANKKACEVLECTETEIINQNWFDNYIPDRMRNDVRFVFKQLMEGKIKPVEYYENPLLTKSGNEKHIAWHNTVIMDEDNHAIGILGSGEDVTEKLKLQAQLQHAQKMETIGNLAGGIAHDFNNILSSIIGFTELALDETPKNTVLEDSLQEVYSAGKRAKDLVKQILAFARQTDEKIGPIKPSNIVKELLGFIRSTIPTSIEIQKEIESESLIMGNATQIHQVLMNLCTNAAQAMDDTGGVLEVSLKDVAFDKEDSVIGLKKGDYLEIKVSDTGVGIVPENIGSIFEPYFTTKEPGEGTGLGLAVVQGVIESYGGKINVESQLGKGTTFTIHLPITKKRSDHNAYVAEKLPTGTERVLFVDDEAPIAKIGSQILERLGYSVTTRTSSIEALKLFQAKPNDFDLVVTDMTMPNLTGEKLAVELMKIRPDIPVILCTGYSKKISEETASVIGIKSFAYKPLVKADLAKTVRKVLDEAKSRNQG
jgi:PAS domain S-box-containing protein